MYCMHCTVKESVITPKSEIMTCPNRVDHGSVRTTMMNGATLALLFLLWPSTSARYGLKTYNTFRAELPQYSSSTPATFEVHRKWRADHTHARADGAGCLAQASPNHLSKTAAVALRETLSSLRGGESGSSDQVSVLTLFVRVFVPSFQRQSEANQEGLDLEGGGLMRRIARLVSGILHKVPRFPRRANANGGGAREMAVGEKKGKKKEKQSTSSHLKMAYRPGNANYRIQKELKEFLTNPPDGCKVSVGKNIRVWIITISGTEGTLYAGEKFRLRVAFPEEYPTKPPAVYFLQSPPPPKHQHIYTNGDICLSLLSSRDWKPNLTVMSLALSILSMLSSAKEKRIPEDNAAHADARPGQAQQWIYHDDLC